MKRALFVLLPTLLVVGLVDSAHAQSRPGRPVVRLGVSSTNINEDKTLENMNISAALGTEAVFFYVGMRVDFNKDFDFTNGNMVLEIGPRFLRAGPGFIVYQNREGYAQADINLSATFKPWRGFYLNSRWAPASLSNRPSKKNFFDAGVGWQFKF